MDLTPYFVAWRTTALKDREVVDALVHPTHAGPSQELVQALRHWDGSHYWSDEPGGRWLVLTRRRSVRAERWWLHIALFVATLFTTTLAGATLAGSLAPLTSPLDLVRGVVHPEFWRAWAAGVVFALPLLGILLAHELGHYVMARHYQLDVSPPYFIPLPVWALVGTLGAFIRLRTVLSDRRQLFDVGLAGPIAGFAVAVPVLFAGLYLSHPLPASPVTSGMVLWAGGERWPLGDSPITLALRWLVHGNTPVLLHPIAFAGFVGMFVTMINLMPMAQLDGGHVLYATKPRLHRRAALAFWLVVLGLGHWWAGWYIWAGLVLVMSRGRLDHPTVLDAYRPLPAARRWLAWVGLVLLILVFAPVPFASPIPSPP
ncbi:MAG: site-2 protease family protein [Gemmatimonadales bacterium]